METDNRITAILARLRGGVVGIYTQRKLDELDKELGTQDWNNFIKELKTTFSNKTKVADTEWRIETLKQEKKNTADFIIEFEALAMKADTDELHAIFLLKKNIGQEYKSTEGRHDYKTSTGTTYGGQGQPMDIGRFNDNFKDRKPKYFNCNKYGHMAKECRAEKKE